jgi:hypothetical protein
MTNDDKHVKYLEMIQAVIARMASNGFAVKGWSTALVTVILAFLAKDGNPAYAWLAFFPIMTFWTLDAYFLSLERAYRGLYNAVRTGCRVDFDLTPPKTDMIRCLFRPAVASIYVMLTAVTLLVWFA